MPMFALLHLGPDPAKTLPPFATAPGHSTFGEPLDSVRPVDDAWFDQFDGLALAAAIRSGQVTAAEAIEVAIGRIEDRNPALNAVIATRFDAARAEAARPLPDGPFTGVPYVVKSLGGAVAGLPTSRGSRLFADDVATADSLAVARARAAGVVVLGMTNTPELGKNGSTEPRFHGPTRNPYDTRRSPGGSSGGSAAAVASGMVPIAHANDGGGSIRIPASACGLFGLKPSRGRVPHAPLLDGFAYPVGCIHAVTRTVRDSDALLDVVDGPVPGGPYPAAHKNRPFLDEVRVEPGPLRIGVTVTTPRGDTADAACVAAVERTSAVCEALGHEVSEAALTYDVEAANQALAAVMAVNVANAVDGRLAELGRELHDDDIEPFTRILYERGRSMAGVEVISALQEVERVGRAVAPFFDAYDVLLTPTLSIEVPELGWADTTRPETMARASAFSAFTGVCNTTGQPAMSIPAGLDGNGVPVGVHFAARTGDETLLFQLAGQLERAMPWPTLPVVPTA
jgi:amidase